MSNKKILFPRRAWNALGAIYVGRTKDETLNDVEGSFLGTDKDLD